MLITFLERRLSFSDSVDAVEILPIDDANESRAYKIMTLTIYITRTFALRSILTLKHSVLGLYYLLNYENSKVNCFREELGFN